MGTATKLLGMRRADRSRFGMTVPISSHVPDFVNFIDNKIRYECNVT